MHEDTRLSIERRAELRGLLETRARSLQAELAQGLHAGDEPGLPNRSGEVDDAVADLEASLDIAAVARDATELDEIRSALDRIDDAAFGFCADCGEPIPWPRLRAQPQAIRCRECAEISERGRRPRDTRAG